jgi:hypothetical protein
MTALKKKYENIVEQYIKKFTNKHGYEFSYWCGPDVGGIACFIDQYFFNLEDIMYDVNNEVKKGMIFQWQDDQVEYGDENTAINFQSYVMGMRHVLTGREFG